jgi:hypothetical protein
MISFNTGGQDENVRLCFAAAFVSIRYAAENRAVARIAKLSPNCSPVMPAGSAVR